MLKMNNKCSYFCTQGHSYPTTFTQSTPEAGRIHTNRDVAVKDETWTGTEQLSKRQKNLECPFLDPEAIQTPCGRHERNNWLFVSFPKTSLQAICAVTGCKHHALPQCSSPGRGQIGLKHDSRSTNRVWGVAMFCLDCKIRRVKLSKTLGNSRMAKLTVQKRSNGKGN